MIGQRFVLGSMFALAGVAGCAHAPSQAPAPAPSPTHNPATPTTISPLPTSTPGANAIGTMAGCPGGNGIHISATGGTLTDSTSGTNQFIGLGQSVDTTMVFNISSKTWTRTNLAAAISVGLADESRGRYAICAGVSALLPSATLTLQGARGRVHFAASLKDLSNALRLGPGR